MMLRKRAVRVLGPMENITLRQAEVKQILSYDKSLKATVVADSISGNDLIVANNGNIYVTAP